MKIDIDVRKNEIPGLKMFNTAGYNKTPDNIQVSVDDFSKDMKLASEVYDDFSRNTSCLKYNDNVRANAARQAVLSDWAKVAGVIHRSLEFPGKLGYPNIGDPTYSAVYRDKTFGDSHMEKRTRELFCKQSSLLEKIKNFGYDENKLMEFRNKYFENSFVHMHKMDTLFNLMRSYFCY